MEFRDIVSKACQLVPIAAELAMVERRLLKIQIFYADQLSSIDTGLHCLSGDFVENISSFYPSLEIWEPVRLLITACPGRRTLTLKRRLMLAEGRRAMSQTATTAPPRQRPSP